MKTRIIDDLIMNKLLYPLVPENEFSMAKLDSVFEQAFTTLRQKYAAQSSSGQAIAQDRGDIKAARARRLGRKKVVSNIQSSTVTIINKYISHVSHCLLITIVLYRNLPTESLLARTFRILHFLVLMRPFS